jgi:hypothetical protein
MMAIEEEKEGGFASIIDALVDVIALQYAQSSK